MKKILTIVVLLIVAALVVFYALNYYIYNEKQADFAAGETATVSGSVVALNFEQIAFDGPYMLTVESRGGEQMNVSVPSMGLPLCAAYGAGNIEDVSLIEVGNEVEVRGTVSEEGAIVPCESADHYLRVSTSTQ